MQDVYDGPWRLFDYDAVTGRTIWVLHDSDGRVVFRVDQPADAILAANAEAEAATHGHRFGEWVRVASVPLQHFHNSGLADAVSQGDEAHLSRFLADSDFAKFRTSRGRF